MHFTLKFFLFLSYFRFQLHKYSLHTHLASTSSSGSVNPHPEDHPLTGSGTRKGQSNPPNQQGSNPPKPQQQPSASGHRKAPEVIEISDSDSESNLSSSSNK